MFSMGLLGTALTDYVGVGNVTRYQVRFARQTWPDEVLSSKIVVTAKREEDGKKLLDLAVTLSNGEGEEKLVGEATASLPYVLSPQWGSPAPARADSVNGADNCASAHSPGWGREAVRRGRASGAEDRAGIVTPVVLTPMAHGTAVTR